MLGRVLSGLVKGFATAFCWASLGSRPYDPLCIEKVSSFRIGWTSAAEARFPPRVPVSGMEHVRLAPM
jgi:hypothetical protein